MRAVVEADGRIRLPNEISEAAHLEPGQELEVSYVPGQLMLFSGEAEAIDEAQLSPEFLAELDEAREEVRLGKSRIFLSTEEFLAHLEAVDDEDAR